jgi:hypothetical protein
VVACGNRHTVFASRSMDGCEEEYGADAMAADIARMRRVSMMAEEAALVPGPFDSACAVRRGVGGRVYGTDGCEPVLQD